VSGRSRPHPASSFRRSTPPAMERGCERKSHGCRRLSGSLRSSSDLHRGNGIPRLGENGIPQARDRPPKIAFRPETVSAEAETQPQEPANCGLLGRLRENCRFERLRDGPERIRTAHHTIMAPRPNWVLIASRVLGCGPGPNSQISGARTVYVSAAREPTAPRC
jgi:hypothetical protein